MVNNLTLIYEESSDDVWNTFSEFGKIKANRRAYWQSLVDSIPDRLSRVIELEGDMTKRAR